MEINKINIGSRKYPIRLEKIKHPPKNLYYLGDPDILNYKYILAVVGTRMISNYGKQVLRCLIPELAKRNILIVSGLARGVDIYAQKLSLDNGGKTVAVMAGGLDEIYPPEHSIFANEIIESGGLIISEHSPRTQYLRQHFPARNRIISGISDAILIIEAKQKSGALITANYALKQNRKLLAVPGSILSEQSQGVNSLFNQSAIPIQDPEDIFKVLFGTKYKRKAKKEKENNNIQLNISEEEKSILKNIPFDRPTTINNIIRNTKQPSANVISIITQLEIKNVIESSEEGYLRIA